MINHIHLTTPKQLQLLETTSSDDINSGKVWTLRSVPAIAMNNTHDMQTILEPTEFQGHQRFKFELNWTLMMMKEDLRF